MPRLAAPQPGAQPIPITDARHVPQGSPLGTDACVVGAWPAGITLALDRNSVFPTAGHANPPLTIVALALRLAERLAGGASG